MFFFFKQKTAYEMRISDWSSDVCSSDLFTLVNRIAPLIRDGGRLVIVASGGHRFADVDLADPNFEAQPYDPWVAYGRSKTANILRSEEHTSELQSLMRISYAVFCLKKKIHHRPVL